MITRFAPSPTGPLHLGHAFSAITAHDMARAGEGQFLLRIEDIDTPRCRPEWEALIFEDLAWLGLSWDGPVMRQSDRMPAYRAALDRLGSLGLLYPCTCSRRDIAAALSAPQEGHSPGFDGPTYPGTCRGKNLQPEGDFALRLNMKKAVESIGSVEYTEMLGGKARVTTRSAAEFIGNDGDIVLARRDIGTSYHLSVVVDDAAQGVSDVVRGADLAPATPVQILLQSLLDLPHPVYHHHRLIRDDTGRRLAKRDDARAIRTYRAEGATPEAIRRLLGLAPR